MNWMTKRFTFVIVPDANQHVRKYRISGLFFILTPIFILLLGILALISFGLFSKSALTINTLKHELSASAQLYEQQLLDKDEHISDMQTDLLLLAEQAQITENKIAEMTELEAQLKELVGISPKSPVSISSLIEEEGGMGGEELPWIEQSSDVLVTETSKQYTEISGQLDELIPQLEDTRLAVIKYQEILKITPTIWPTDSRRVTSLFGVRKDPFTGRSTYHSGLDIGGNNGDPIYAAADGVVTLSERDRIYGNNVWIDHGRGISTRYLHLKERSVEAGDKVVKGQVIGQLGSTGRSTGPHLHYEVFVNGENVNPEPYIKADRKEP